MQSLALADRGYVLENGRIVMSGGGELLADDGVSWSRRRGARLSEVGFRGKPPFMKGHSLALRNRCHAFDFGSAFSCRQLPHQTSRTVVCNERNVIQEIGRKNLAISDVQNSLAPVVSRRGRARREDERETPLIEATEGQRLPIVRTMVLPRIGPPFQTSSHCWWIDSFAAN